MNVVRHSLTQQWKGNHPFLAYRTYATPTVTPSTPTPPSFRPYLPPYLASTSMSSSTASSSSPSTPMTHRLVHLYRAMPKGPAPPLTRLPTDSFLERYSQRHFSRGHESARPILHTIVLVAGIGYTMLYFQHIGMSCIFI
ncbi:hypothetical protein HMI55_006482 [Coelomomyces lativittatus]|nr:hypothetical protein HMI55_006482 [Coelomomyces lativittatus]KAJ1514347.1 hypothetical protein HMI56_000632 [Coelomomyces lativittatus]